MNLRLFRGRKPPETAKKGSVQVTDVELDSYWRPRARPSWSFYCPLCRSARRLPYSPQPPRARLAIQLLLTTAVSTAITWPIFGWKGMVSVVVYASAFEIFWRLRIRAAVSCPHCGFDPFLYAVDHSRARSEVEAYWKKKLGDDVYARANGSAQQQESVAAPESEAESASADPRSEA